MPSKTVPPVWRRAFLRALGKGATVIVAARHAGVGRNQPYRIRRKNPVFASLWDEALQRGRDAIAAGHNADDLMPAPPRPVIRKLPNGGTRVVNAAEVHLSDEKAEQFLKHLAATANVTTAAEAVGISRAALYQRRKQWPGFAEAWDEAKAYALDRLEFLLIERATNSFVPPAIPKPDLLPVTFEQAMRVVQNGQAITKRGEPSRRGWRRKPVDIEALGEELLRRLRVIRGTGGPVAPHK